MLLEKLRQQIATLTPEAFEQVSTCIEALQTAVLAAGPTGILALEYTRIAAQEKLALALKTSQLALRLSIEQRESLSQNVLALGEALRAANAKLAKKASVKKVAKKKKVK